MLSRVKFVFLEVIAGYGSEALQKQQQKILVNLLLSQNKLGPMLLVYDIPPSIWGPSSYWALLQQVLSEGWAAQGVYSSWGRRDPQLEMFCLCSQLSILMWMFSSPKPPALGNTALWERAFMACRLPQPTAIGKSEGGSAVNPLPGTSGGQREDGAQGKDRTCFLLFRRAGKDEEHSLWI